MENIFSYQGISKSSCVCRWEMFLSEEDEITLGFRNGVFNQYFFTQDFVSITSALPVQLFCDKAHILYLSISSSQ